MPAPTDHKHLLAWWNLYRVNPVDPAESAMLAAAEADLREMRLQRDVLALNWQGRDSGVFVAYAADNQDRNILGVCWPTKNSPSSAPAVKLPHWYTDPETPRA